jgi:hypothetical protein
LYLFNTMNAAKLSLEKESDEDNVCNNPVKLQRFMEVVEHGLKGPDLGRDERVRKFLWLHLYLTGYCSHDSVLDICEKLFSIIAKSDRACAGIIVSDDKDVSEVQRTVLREVMQGAGLSLEAENAENNMIINPEKGARFVGSFVKVMARSDTFEQFDRLNDELLLETVARYVSFTTTTAAKICRLAWRIPCTIL